MKKYFFSLAIMFIAIFVCIALFASLTTITPLKPIRLYGDYEKYWAKVDSLEKLGLTASSKKEVENIRELAQKETNYPQLVKSLIFLMKYSETLEEESFLVSYQFLEQEIIRASSPYRQVLHSLRGTLLWNYYQAHRWQFYERTPLKNNNNDDIRTWDLQRLFAESLLSFRQSLSEPHVLQNILTEKYDAILEGNDTLKTRRPTLYDILAHKALDVLQNAETGLTQPADAFEMNRTDFLSAAERFAKQAIQTTDTLSNQYQALLIYQQLIIFHLQKKQWDALVDVDLNRIKYVYSQTTLEAKDSLHIQALNDLQQKHVSSDVTAEVLVELAIAYRKQGEKYDAFNEQTHRYRMDILKATQLCDEAMQRYPKTLGANNSKALKEQMLVPALEITTEHGNLPGEHIPVNVRYRNLQEVHLKLYAVNYDEWIAEEKQYQHNRFAGLLMYLQKLQPVASLSQPLNASADLQHHTTELALTPSNTGFYVLLASDQASSDHPKAAVALSVFWVTNLMHLSRPENNYQGNTILVVGRKNGLPVQDAEVRLYQEKYNYLNRRYEQQLIRTLKSNKEGELRVPYLGKENYTNYQIELRKGKDRYASPGLLYQYRDWNEHYDEKSISIHYFLDRAIYRPGQTVHFKGIAINRGNFMKGTESKIVANYKTKINLRDANYQEVTSMNVTTNEFGTFSGSFELPVNLLAGEWTMGNDNSRTSFSVEEYKRPKFELRFDTIRDEFRLGEQVTLSGSATALSGFAIDGAQVAYRIYRNARFPPWFYWRSGYFDDSPSMEIAGGTAVTDENGRFSVHFEAIPDRSISKVWEPVFHYTIEISVTDLNGETRTATRKVRAGYASIQVVGSVPAFINRHDTMRYKLNILNMENYPVPRSGQITITRMEEPPRLFKQKGWSRADEPVMSESSYLQAFPNLPFADEHLAENWKRGEVILHTTFSNETNNMLKPANLPSLKQGVYLVEAKATDARGEQATYRQIVKVYDLNETKPFVQEFLSFIPVKTHSEPGEEGIFLISSAAKQVQVRIEVEHRGQMVSKQIIRLNNAQRVIRIPVTEIYRGGFGVHFTAIIENRVYSFHQNMTVPYSNKELKLKFASFRNELLPSAEEEWKITVKDLGNQKATAEMLVSMYDASLDAFRPSAWRFNPHSYGYRTRQWTASDHLHLSHSSLHAPAWATREVWRFPQYQYMSHFGCIMLRLEYTGWMYPDGMFAGFATQSEVMDPESVVVQESEISTQKKPTSNDNRNEKDVSGNTGSKNEKQNQFDESDPDIDKGMDGEVPHIRSNFVETAFFYPHLQTNELGEVVFSFRMPESITRWNFQALAHTRDLKFGLLTEQVITKKQLMVNSFAPRFFREGDRLYFSTKVTNLSDQDLPVSVSLALTDAINQNNIASLCKLANSRIQRTVPKGKSELFVWEIEIPQQVYAITYQVVADGGLHSDGEEMTIPVLSNRMLVTESLPLSIREKTTRSFTFDKLRQSVSSSTLQHHRLTLEFTSQPAWYAIQALPYMMEYPFECSEQLFNRLYANTLASHIINSNPRIKKVFDVWKTQQPSALLSALEKNQELKEAVLQETPWVMDARNETERKQRIALLFDLNHMQNETSAALHKLEKLQAPNGGWPWFAGGPDNRFITQYIVTGFGRLKKLGVQNYTSRAPEMISKALFYLDERMYEDYNQLKKHKAELPKKQISYTQIQYLFARSYFPEKELDIRYQEAYNYYFSQAKTYWNAENMMMRAMIALMLQRSNEANTAQMIVRSLGENAIRHEELGMYWKQNNTYFWYNAPIETQALMIEAFGEILADKKDVEDMQVWLLKNKQTNDWKTTKATADACYALLMQNVAWLEDTDPVVVNLGDITVDPKTNTDIHTEAGTGYFKTSWNKEAIRADMGNISVQKNTDGVAWGAVYWQYFENLDKITKAATNVKITKKLFKQVRLDRGPVLEAIGEKAKLQVGDRVRVRVEITTDRNLEYVHLKDLRASAFEPENVFSGYRWQDGIGYYESTRDAASHFFIEFLPRGTYVFEYPVRATHRGVFSNGITTLQCMYAPEFSSHSEGLTVRVE